MSKKIDTLLNRHVASFLKSGWDGDLLIQNKILTSKTNKKGGNQINYNIDNFQKPLKPLISLHIFTCSQKVGDQLSDNSILYSKYKKNVCCEKTWGVESPPPPLSRFRA